MTKTLEFDYVIVGGGVAGCIIVARLAAESDCSVALIERDHTDSAGSFQSPKLLMLSGIGPKDHLLQ